MSKKLAEELIDLPDDELFLITRKANPATVRQFLRNVIRDSYLEGVRKTREGCAETIDNIAWMNLTSEQTANTAKSLCLSYRDELEEPCKKS